MSTIEQILGYPSSIDEDAPPMQVARTRQASPVRREPPKDKEEKKLRSAARQSSIVASIIGMTEDDNEGIIPHEAKRLDATFSNNIPGVTGTPELGIESPAEPSTDSELIPPTAALVAPDVTPKVFEPIDPSKVPAPVRPSSMAPGMPTAMPGAPSADGALNTILGRQNPSPGYQPAPVAVESFMQAINPMDVKTKAAESMVPGAGMPEHKEGDGRTLFNAMRNIMG